jgi:Cu/Ag efflux pump CusA
MNRLLKEIVFMFLLIVFSNMITEIGEEQKVYLTKPLKFFGGAFVLSIIGGYLSYRINTLFKSNRS